MPNILVCSTVTKFGIFKFLEVGVKADRLKPVQNDFQLVYFFIERRGGGAFYKLELWNGCKYLRLSRLRRIDAFDSVLLASFVALLLSPNYARCRASNLCVLHNASHTYKPDSMEWLENR